MAMKTVVSVAALVFMLADAAQTQPVAASDIIYGTGEVIYDIYAGIYDAAAGAASKHGIDTKVREHLNPILSADHIGLACSKLGCNKKDITDKLGQAQSAVLQIKAQAYEHGAKAREAMNGLAEAASSKLEKHLPPSYKGHIPKNFVDLVLYVALRISWKVFSIVLSIYCCVCCCGCCRGRR